MLRWEDNSGVQPDDRLLDRNMWLKILTEYLCCVLTGFILFLIVQKPCEIDYRNKDHHYDTAALRLVQVAS
jgi:hypothetical protein